MSYWYFATPYSKYRKGLDAAFEEASKQAALLLKAGIHIYAAIPHTHPMQKYGDIPPESVSPVWSRLDMEFMQHAEGMIVCCMEGWSESVGIREEEEYFFQMRKPIVYMQLDEVPGHFSDHTHQSP